MSFERNAQGIWADSTDIMIGHLPLSPQGCRPPSSTPCRDRRRAVEHFRDPPPRALGGALRQPTRRKEAAGDDLMVRLGHAVLAELPDDVDRDMIPAGDMTVEKQTVQFGLARRHDAALLGEFARQRRHESLADLDATAG